MDHEQFETLIAAILTAGRINREGAATDPVPLLAKTLEDLRGAEIIIKKNVAFIPKGGRGSS